MPQLPFDGDFGGGGGNRRERAKLSLEHPERARNRVEAAITIQSLMRRFLARVLVCQASLIFGINHD